METLTTYVLPHWPFVAVALILAMVVQVFKNTLFTAEFARVSRFSWWGRKTLPLHPAILGALVGLSKTIAASPGVDTKASRILYFAFAGVASAWVFAIVQGFLKKEGIVLKLDGTSDPPPAGELVAGEPMQAGDSVTIKHVDKP